MKRSLLLIVACFLLLTASSQQLFEGRVTYEFKLTGEGTEAYSMFMPTGMTIDALKGNTSVELQGGIVSGVGRYFSNISKNKMYRVVDSEETVYESEITATENPNQTVVKLDETATISGLVCHKYAINQINDGVLSVSYAWINTDYYFSESNTGNSGAGGIINTTGIQGLCLKVESETEGITVIITASVVSFEKPSKNLFKIPKKYQVVQESPAGM
jgi:hypothetical protein